MPDIVLILWLPAAIAFMAVAWVLALGAIGRPQEIGEEALRLGTATREEV